jgi:hypothetical protein
MCHSVGALQHTLMLLGTQEQALHHCLCTICISLCRYAQVNMQSWSSWPLHLQIQWCSELDLAGRKGGRHALRSGCALVNVCLHHLDVCVCRLSRCCNQNLTLLSTQVTATQYLVQAT